MQPNNRNSRPTTPVMDVQRPVSTPPRPTVSPPQSESLGRPATMEYTRPRQSESQVPAFDPEKFHQEEKHQPVSPKEEKQKSKKALIITLAVVFVMLLIGAGVAYYITTQNDETPVAPVVSQPEPPATEDGVSATPEGIDQTITEIDKQLNSVDDAADFKPNDVSDEGIGL